MADEALAVNDLAANTAPVEDSTPIPDATAAPENASQSGDQQPGDEKVAKTFTQEELDDILQKRIAKEQRKAQREADRRVAEALARQQPQPKVLQPAEDNRPKPENFQTTEDYVEAVAEFKAKQIIERQQREEAETRTAREQERHQREIFEAHSGREDDARERYADYDDVISNPRLPINAIMADAIRTSEQGPDVAYYLGKHPAEALRIAKLPPILAVKEMGKLEAKLAAEPPAPSKRSSSAPAPISPVRPASGAGYTSLESPQALKALGTSGLIAAWNKQEAERRQKGH